MIENDSTLIDIGRRAIDREVARRAVQRLEEVGARQALRDARHTLADADRSFEQAVAAAIAQKQDASAR